MLSAKLLQKFAPFNELPPTYLKEALKHCELRNYLKGEMFLKRNRKDQCRTFLVEGRVDLISTDFSTETVDSLSEKRMMALNPEGVRVSAIAKSPVVEVIQIDADELNRIVAWNDSHFEETAYADGLIEFEHTETAVPVGEVEEITEKRQDWMSSLVQSPLFHKIPLPQVQELFRRFETIEAVAGEMIVQEGEAGDYFYVIASGRAKLFSSVRKSELSLEPGTFFGEEALLGDTLRNASIQMVSDGLIKRLSKHDFAALLKSPVLDYISEPAVKKLQQPYRLLDVKMPIEFRVYHKPGSLNVPLTRLRTALCDLPKDPVYIIPDDAGGRADIAAHLLCQAGFQAKILRSPKIEEAVPEGASH